MIDEEDEEEEDVNGRDGAQQVALDYQWEARPRVFEEGCQVEGKSVQCTGSRRRWRG